MSEEIDCDLTENDCTECGEVFYTYYTFNLEGTDPRFCPYCGIEFTTKNGKRMKETP